MLKVSVVSYLNSMPFIHGIQSSNSLPIQLELAVPSQTVFQFQHGLCDIALISAAALPHLSAYKLLKKYCIGAYKKVDSVLLFANNPISQINKVWLDEDSVTSNLLCKVLMTEHWKMPQVVFEYGNNEHLGLGEAKLEIGNKALLNKTKYKYGYDLASEWFGYCQQPMVFAVWVAKASISDSVIHQFNELLKVGIDAIATITQDLTAKQAFAHININDYLKNCIDYDFDTTKQAALSLYLQKIKNYQ